MSKEKQTFKNELRALQIQAYKFHKQIEKQSFNLTYKYDLDMNLEDEIKGFHIDIETLLDSICMPEKNDKEKEKIDWLSKINLISGGQ